jgi:hypothetical protein
LADEEALFIKGSSAFISSSLKGSEKLLLLLYMSIADAIKNNKKNKKNIHTNIRSEQI